MELEVIIGLEIHAQLNTKTKLFCSCDNDAFGAAPNTKVCPVCMGFPGMLPVLNKAALRKGVTAGAALGCEVMPYSKFDRKNYFYPDLPNGFQISQFDEPICGMGRVHFLVGDEEKSIQMTRVHLEIDAGKLSHTTTHTLCDYNRSGTPLVEMVTEPELRSAEEARDFAKQVQRILRYTNASDADMEKGMMRFDASVSLRPMGDTKLYPRAEIKNLNSFTALYKAISYEVKKQTKLWEAGTPPISETTVGWLDDKGVTKLLRDKESAHDYRYFPEPDLPPMTWTEEQIQEIHASIPELPMARYKRYRAAGINHENAYIMSDDRSVSDFYDAAVATGANAKKTLSVITSVLMAEDGWINSKITPQIVGESVQLAAAGTISSSGLKKILLKAMETRQSATEIMKSEGLEQVQDTGQMEAWADEVIAANEASVSDYKNGKEQALQYLVGQTMKISRGQANPGKMVEILREKIGR